MYYGSFVFPFLSTWLTVQHTHKSYMYTIHVNATVHELTQTCTVQLRRFAISECVAVHRLLFFAGCRFHISVLHKSKCH